MVAEMFNTIEMTKKIFNIKMFVLILIGKLRCRRNTIPF